MKLTLKNLFSLFFIESAKSNSGIVCYTGRNQIPYAIVASQNMQVMDRMHILFDNEIMTHSVYSQSENNISSENSFLCDKKDERLLYLNAIMNGSVNVKGQKRKNNTHYAEALLNCFPKVEDIERNAAYLKSVLNSTYFPEKPLNQNCFEKNSKQYISFKSHKKVENILISQDSFEVNEVIRSQIFHCSSFVDILKGFFIDEKRKYLIDACNALSINLDYVFIEKGKDQDKKKYYQNLILDRVSRLLMALICYSLYNLDGIDSLSRSYLHYNELYQFIEKSHIGKDHLYGFAYKPGMNDCLLRNSDRFVADYQSENLAVLEKELLKEEGKICNIYGLPGIGKSELLDYFIADNIRKKIKGLNVSNPVFKEIDYVYKLTCPSEDNTEDMLRNMIADMSISSESQDTREKAFSNNLSILRQKGKSLLLYIDNYKNHEYYEKEFSKTNPTLKKLMDTGIRILVVSNDNLSNANKTDIVTKTVHEISNTNLCDLFVRITNTRNNNHIAKYINDRLFNNTYSVVLVSNLIKELSTSEKNADKIADRIFSGLNNSEKESGIGSLFKAIICEYDPVLKTEDIQYTLLNACCMPEEGIEKNIFLQMISGVDINCSKALEKLIEINFLNKRNIDGREYISIHQLVRVSMHEIVQDKKEEILPENCFKESIEYLYSNESLMNYHNFNEIAFHVYQFEKNFYVTNLGIDFEERASKNGKTYPYYRNRKKNQPSLMFDMLSKPNPITITEIRLAYLLSVYDDSIEDRKSKFEHSSFGVLLLSHLNYKKTMDRNFLYTCARACNSLGVILFNSQKEWHEYGLFITDISNNTIRKGKEILELLIKKKADNSFPSESKIRELEPLLEGNYYTCSNITDPYEKIRGYIVSVNKRKQYMKLYNIPEISYVRGLTTISNKFSTKYRNDEKLGCENKQDLINSFSYSCRFISEVNSPEYNEEGALIIGRNHFIYITRLLLESNINDVEKHIVLAQNGHNEITLRDEIVNQMILCLTFFKEHIFMHTTYAYLKESFSLLMENPMFKNLPSKQKEDEIIKYLIDDLDNNRNVSSL